ncbi:TolB family protein [Nocardioides dilutus]
MRRHPLVLLAALAVLFASLAVGPGSEAAPTPRKKPTLTVSPAAPLQGTAATFRTRLPTKVKRPALLQRKDGQGWVKVAKGSSKPNGKVVFKNVVVPGDAQWRVRAKAVWRGGDKLRAVTTKVRQVGVTLRAELVSATPSGGSTGTASSGASISDDGRYVAFASSSSLLVPGTTGYVAGQTQIFLRDRTTGTTRLVSHQPGAPTLAGGGPSWWPRLSADGRFVVFVSSAEDLVAGDTGGHQDIFRWDQVTGTTIRVSEDVVGSNPDGDSYDPSVSADGGVVAYTASATDIDLDDDNGVNDVYVWRASSGESEWVSTDVLGGESNEASGSAIVSAPGTFVSFSSAASDLVFNDDNGKRDVFRRNLAAGTTALVSRGVSAGGDDNASSGRSAISPDGRYVAFASLADNLVTDGPADNGKLNVFVRDMTAGATVLVSRGPGGAPTSGHSLPPEWVSSDGSRVLYTSIAPDLVLGDTNGVLADALIWERSSGTSALVVRNRFGGQPNGSVFEPSITPDGRWLAFHSTATDLVPQDLGPDSDSYVWRMP